MGDELSSESIIEALLFSSSKAVPVKDLARLADLTITATRKVLANLASDYSQGKHGVELVSYNDAFHFRTKKFLSDYVKKLYQINKITGLSQAAMETLAIIAYRQPVTRSEIEEIRGVKAEKTLFTLGKYELIEELGRKETIGNPIVYGTTAKFLQYLDLEDLGNLPEKEKVMDLFSKNEIENN